MSLLTGLNLLGKATGWFSPFYQSETLDKLDPEKQAELLKEYYKSLDLDASSLPSKETFATYDNARTKNIDGFSKLTALNGGTIADKLADSRPGATAVKDAVSNALKLTDGTINARKEFEAGMTRVHDAYEAALKNPKARFHPGHMRSYIQELQSNAHTAIKEQHSAEEKALKAQFDDPGFKANLTASLGLDAAGMAQMKKEMLETLAASQKKELDTFDKAINEPLIKMHNAAKLAQYKFYYFATLREHNMQMQKEIDRLHDKNQKDGNPHVRLQQGIDKDHAYFAGMELKDLNTLQTITGRPITPMSDGTFEMQLPNRILSVGYYNSSHNSLKADMMGIAGAVRASGYSSITMTVEHKNKEHAMELGRAAFEACLELGFDGEDPKAITIMVGAEKMSVNDLFKDCPPSRLAAIYKSAQNAEKGREKVEKSVVNDGTYDRFKDALNTGRLDQEDDLGDTLNKESPTAKV